MTRAERLFPFAPDRRSDTDVEPPSAACLAAALACSREVEMRTAKTFLMVLERALLLVLLTSLAACGEHAPTGSSEETPVAPSPVHIQRGIRLCS